MVGVFQLILKRKSYAKKVKSVDLGGGEGRNESFESMEVVAGNFSQVVMLALRNNIFLSENSKKAAV